MHKRDLFLWTAAGALVLAIASYKGTGSTYAPQATVIDGDTIVVQGEHIRLLGFDAPEVHARCVQEALLAGQATAKLRSLLQSGLLLSRQGKDKYQRTLARVYTSKGQDVAQIMIASGLARPYGGERRQSWCQ